MRQLCFGLLTACVWCLIAAPEVSAERPNVVLIMTDDQGYGDFSCHGNPVLKTPNLDALAAQSVRLTDFHVAPVCTPTRGQLLTGLDALRNGATSATGQRFLLKRGIPTMGDVFRTNGYRTALYGKWHLGGNFQDFMPHQRGFDDAVHYLRGGVQSHPNYWNNDLFDDTLYHNGELQQYPGYATDVWFDLGTEFVRKCRRDGAPFFLYLPLNAPHGPLLVPDRYREPYKHLDKETATFFGMIATVDERIATFLQALESEGLRDDTIVIFLTDNGTANGEKIHNAGMRGKKGALYEGGHRVPCWISWPNGKLRSPQDVDALAQCQDILPTLIELCGLTPPEGRRFDGVSLAALLRGEPQPELDERMLVVQKQDRKGPGTVMWRKWRLVENELYDLAADPGQKQNLTSERREIVDRLRQHYDRWWEGVEPCLQLEPYRIGVDRKEMMLTAYDWWYGRQIYNWPHLRRGDTSNGKYTLIVGQPGQYRIALRRWPKESGAGICEGVERYVSADPFTAYDDAIAPFPPGKALDIVQARVRFGDQEQSQPVQRDDREVAFDFTLPKGPSELQTWFTARDGAEFGAYYVFIQRQSGDEQSLNEPRGSADDWPAFSGPRGDGIALHADPPLTWGPEQNIKWRVEAPGSGHGSPIVVGDRVLLAAADNWGRERGLYCYHRDDGRLLWRQVVSVAAEELTHKDNPYCGSTPASDGNVVVVWHGTGGLHLYSLDGEHVWSRDFGEIRHLWGYANSPIIVGDRVVLQNGVGSRMFVAAVSLADGSVIWNVEEPGGLTNETPDGDLTGSWSTPITVSSDGRNLIVCAMPTRVVAYDADDGRIVWTCDGLTGERGKLAYASPIVANGTVVAMGGYMGPALAVRADGLGNGPQREALWRVTEHNPQRIGSGVVVGDSVFIANADGGSIQCLDLKTGRERWRQRVSGGPHWASTVFAAGLLFATNRSGTTRVFRPNAERFELVAENALDETVSATPAVSGREIFIRTDRSLYCLSKDSRRNRNTDNR